eukprot:NODE_4330_length_351_cov_696.350993_g3730_i0.p1 GENE.NODE_4330_length_351_cov_696.350993_g3730_i0~~NODE_4330_length_351_cov_696.350993_g3730_i0.p1  ORF type:complete len:101 (-),score=19.82 NODE_4330_length_351_cov_696.350993_g3730_i0:19-321(-)
MGLSAEQPALPPPKKLQDVYDAQIEELKHDLDEMHNDARRADARRKERESMRDQISELQFQATLMLHNYRTIQQHCGWLDMNVQQLQQQQRNKNITMART